MNNEFRQQSIRNIGIFFAASVYLGLASACAEPVHEETFQPSTQDSEGDSDNEDDNDTESESGSEIEDILPSELADTFQEFWDAADELNRIYCDCDPDWDLCWDIPAEIEQIEYECTVEAIALDPEGSKYALKCDRAWAKAELECLQDAKSCDEIETPPGDEATCDEQAQEIIDACPSYPEKVEEALYNCYERR